VDELVLDEEVEKGDDAGKSRPHRGDMHTPILPGLDESFEVNPFDLLDVTLARRSVKAEEEHH
jgi:hypothetical protein